MHSMIDSQKQTLDDAEHFPTLAPVMGIFNNSRKY